MTHSPINLSTLLEEELTLIDALIDILAQEKSVLLSRQFNALEELSNVKQTLSVQIEQSARKRLELMSGSDNPSLYKQSFENYLTTCTAEDVEKIIRLNDTLNEKLLHCRDQNMVNGQVITSNMNTRQAIVNALTGQENAHANGLYTATGNIKKGADLGRHELA